MLRPIRNDDVIGFFNSGPYQKSFLYQWICYCAHRTDAPLAYHVMSGLAALSALAPPSLRYMSHGGLRFPTIMPVLLGSSTQPRKSTCVNLARKFIHDIAPACVTGTLPGSHEAMIDMIAANPNQFWPVSEFSKFLAFTAKPMYLPIRNELCSAYDGDPISRGLVDTIATGQEAADTRLTLLGGLSLDYFEQFVTEADTGGGFLARLALMYAAREVEPQPLRPLNVEWYNQMLERGWRFNQLQIAPEGINEGFSPEAEKLWMAFERQAEALIRSAPSDVGPSIGRAREFAHRVAVLLSVESGAYWPDRKWKLHAQPVRMAIEIGSWVIRSATQVIANLADTNYRRNRRKLLTLLSGNALSEGQLMRELLIPHFEFQRLIASVMAEGRVRTLPLSIGKPLYCLVSDAEIEAQDSAVTLDHMAESLTRNLPEGHDFAVRVDLANNSTEVEPKTAEAAAALDRQTRVDAAVLDAAAARSEAGVPADPEIRLAAEAEARHTVELQIQGQRSAAYVPDEAAATPPGIPDDYAYD